MPGSRALPKGTFAVLLVLLLVLPLCVLCGDKQQPSSLLAAICAFKPGHNTIVDSQLRSLALVCDQNNVYPVVKIFSTATWANHTGKHYCHRMMHDIKVSEALFPVDIGIKLCAQHRAYFKVRQARKE